MKRYTKNNNSVGNNDTRLSTGEWEAARARHDGECVGGVCWMRVLQTRYEVEFEKRGKPSFKAAAATAGKRGKSAQKTTPSPRLSRRST